MAEGLQSGQQVLLDAGQGEHGAPAGDLHADRVHGLERGEVHFDVGLDVEHEPAQGARRPVRGGQGAPASRSPASQARR